MDLSLLNTITLFAYAALAADFLLQIHRVWARKHSADVSIIGVVVRTTAAAIILLKVAAVGDTFLIVGQLAMVTLLLMYLAVVFRFRKTL